MILALAASFLYNHNGISYPMKSAVVVAFHSNPK